MNEYTLRGFCKKCGHSIYMGSGDGTMFHFQKGYELLEIDRTWMEEAGCL